jgi:hypothetical protein
MIAALLLVCLQAPVTELDRGRELARAGQFEEARRLLLDGRRRHPGDQRFAIELAGIAYRLEQPGAAKAYLREALRLEPGDAYANQFLATLYFLDGNPEAALVYWNRVAKPRLEQVRFEPELSLDRLFLERNLAASAGAVLSAADWRTSQARLERIRALVAPRLELVAQESERFDLVVRSRERPGWRHPAAWARGLAFQSLFLDVPNLDGAGNLWRNVVRWDAQKRRALTMLEGPLRRGPGWSYTLWADGRREVWNSGADDYRVDKFKAGAELHRTPGAAFTWTSGVYAATRRFANLPGQADGTSLEYRTGLRGHLLGVPEQRLALEGAVQADLGKLFVSEGGLFAKWQTGVAGTWYPQARGQDFATEFRLRAGRSSGAPPFDELFLLGVERDNDLPLRGHVGTRGGKKGSSPLARDYLLASGEVDKILWRPGYLTLTAGPFLDLAHIWREVIPARAPGWLVDTGAQLKVTFLGSFTLAATYGRDLRGGTGAFYLSFNRQGTQAGSTCNFALAGC